MAMLPVIITLICFSLQSSSATEDRKKTFIFSVDASSKPSVFPTHEQWYAAEFASDSYRVLHLYDTVFHGFAARLTQSQASSLSTNPGVLSVLEDKQRHIHITRSPQFLGLRNQWGLWSDSDYGSDVIIGVFDTGVWPERVAFSDSHLGPVPDRWKGICQAGERFPADTCNKKLIGARYFLNGHESGEPILPFIGFANDTNEYESARDADGHGTHTASTAAGRHSFNASMMGYAPGVAKGVAPKARLAVYKVCKKDSGCFDSDILAGFDAAVKDGVDVISISIGGSDGISSPYYLDPIAIGAFGAVSHGVFVASSAGNDGPSAMSVTNLAPWITTVGGGTIDRSFPADVMLGNKKIIVGESLYDGPPLDLKAYSLVYPGKDGILSASLCMENSLDPETVKGKIVICDRGSSPRVSKGQEVKRAGGVGMILANSQTNGEGLVADAHVLPSCTIGFSEGNAVKKYASSIPNPTATIVFKGTVVGVRPAPVVASFSGRGPNGLNPQVLKPDLIAPGVNILAAWTDAVGPSGLGSDTRTTAYNILSGTSMACPHVSGAAALLKSAHPDWSPAMIKSAMMTTASTTNNMRRPLTDDATNRAASPYDFGAGHLNLVSAMNPGLVFDIGSSDYVNFMCGLDYGTNAIQVITRSPVVCPKKKPLPQNLNYPSIVAVFPTSSAHANLSFIRTVSNVGPTNCLYRATVTPPDGVTVSLKPRKLVFTELVKKQSFVVTVAARTRTLVLGNIGAVFGAITWSDGKHLVRTTLVVTQMDIV